MLEKRLGKIDFAEFGSMKDSMRDDEEPETHTFQQSSEFGVFEGTVTIIESVVEGENAS